MNESDLFAGLNPSQITAVKLIEGPLLILAGPGSGKTRVITHRIAHMIQTGIDPRSIVALTFTNKAAGEMRSRLERIVGPNDVWLGTFHGFCVRLLRRYARLVGLTENFNIYDADDAKSALSMAVENAKFELTHVPLAKLAQRISYFKNRLVTPEILQAEALSSDEYQVGQVYPHYQQLLLHHSAVDFDDILMHVATLLRSYPELRQQLDERFRYIVVDEYQDTNLAQYVIVRHLSFDYPNLAATGDPDQSIYGWRGANIKNVTNLEKDFPNLRVLRLEENYRSTPEILSIADCLIQNNEFRKEKTLIPLRSAGQNVRLGIYPTARREAEDIADQIAALVNEGGRNFSDFGVLYRTNANSRLMEQALARRQIPFQLIGGYRFYARKEIKDLVAYLLLINNPDDSVALRRAINTPPRGIGKQTIQKISDLATGLQIPMLEACRHALANKLLSKRAATAMAGFLKIYDQLVSIVHGPLLDLLQATIELTGYREYLHKAARDSESDSDVASNLDELLAEAREIDITINDEKSALETFLEISALQADTDRLNTQQDLVTLMTLHAAKGLEFTCVYIIAVEENILPHARSKDDPMSLEEERRLLFVGITRAKDQLQLSFAKSRGFTGQGSGVPSSFLMELPRSEMVISDQTESMASYYDTGGHFDDYHDDPVGDWDEASQIDPRHEESHADVEFDDACQLPPDEMQQRLAKLRKSSGRRLMLGSHMASAETEEEEYEDLGDGEAGGGEVVQWSQFRTGRRVLHAKFGEGEIVSASGQGPKRAVTIRFLSDGARRTFRLSHVDLEIV